MKHLKNKSKKKERKGNKGNYGSIDKFNVMPMTRRSQSKQNKKRADEKKPLGKKSLLSQRSVKHKLNKERCSKKKISKNALLDKGLAADLAAAQSREEALLNGKKSRKKRQEQKKKVQQKQQAKSKPNQGGRRKSDTFVLRIPSQKQSDQIINDDVPWVHSTLEQTHSLDFSGMTITEKLMHRLDFELNSFASYVKLSPMEHRARSYAVSHISQTANAVFQVSTQEQLRVLPFGSFATPDICTFVSDVDLAIWGVVPPQESSLPVYTGRHTYFHDHHSHEDLDNVTSESESSLPRLTQSSYQRTMQALRDSQRTNSPDKQHQQQPNRKKSKFSAEKLAKIQKWKDALNKISSGATAQSPIDVESHHINYDKEQDKQPQKDQSMQIQESPSLFVIDRAGDTVPSMYTINTNDDIVSSTTKTTNSKNQRIVDLTYSNDSPKREQGKGTYSTVSNNNGREKEIQEKEENDFLFLIDRDGVKQFHEDDGNGSDREEKKEDDDCEIIRIENAQNSVFATSATTPLNVAPASSNRDNTNISVTHVDDNSYATDNDVETESKVNDEDDDDDDDSADKMKTYSQHHPPIDKKRNDEDDARKKDCYQHCENLNDSDDSYADNLQRFLNGEEDIDSDEGDDDNGFEVSCVIPNLQQDNFDTNPHSLSCSSGSGDGKRKYSSSSIRSSPSPRSFRTAPTAFGPTGKTRKKVIAALRLLGKKLWKSPLAHMVEVRRHARVPIINVATRFGFEGDIALGGHNGTDTSHYAAGQVQQYRR
eukprot:15364436-Ditylum_brightwellii.AAC.1